MKNANRILSAAGYHVESIVLKIYSEFSCSAKISERIESLKEFCEFTSVQYKRDTGTRQEMGFFFFKKENAATELLKVVSFVFSVLVSNAYAERVFSHMENVWSDKRSRMSVGLVKAELQVRLNFKLACLEFKAFIEGQPGLLQAAKRDEKYIWKKR